MQDDIEYKLARGSFAVVGDHIIVSGRGSQQYGDFVYQWELSPTINNLKFHKNAKTLPSEVRRTVTSYAKQSKVSHILGESPMTSQPLDITHMKEPPQEWFIAPNGQETLYANMLRAMPAKKQNVKKVQVTPHVEEMD